MWDTLTEMQCRWGKGGDTAGIAGGYLTAAWGRATDGGLAGISLGREEVEEEATAAGSIGEAAAACNAFSW